MTAFDPKILEHREQFRTAILRAGIDPAISEMLPQAQAIRALITGSEIPASEREWDQRISGAIAHLAEQEARRTPTRGWVGCIYGKAKVGKSTLAMQAPGAVCCDVEDGLGWIDGEKWPCTDWKNFRGICDKFVESKYQTLVIDTADMLEKHLWEWVMVEHKLKSMVADWQLGYTLAAQEWVRELKIIRHYAATSKKNFLFTAHQNVIDITNTEGEAYEQATINLHKKSVEHFFAQMDFCAQAHFELVTRKNEAKDILGITSGNRLLNVGCETLSAMVGNRFGIMGKVPMDASFYKLLGRRN